MNAAISAPREAVCQPWRPPLRLAALALAYFALALLALRIGQESLHAVPLWPAAGLALAVLAVWGWRYWPAIWIGAFAANLLAGTPLTLAAWIAVGIALQAVLGALLTRRFLRAAEPLATERDALLFLFLGGPLACLVSATVGVAGLHFFGGLPVPMLAADWLTWWAGDSFGVLLAAPLVLLVLPETRRHWRGHGLQVASPLLVVCGLLVGGYFWLVDAEQDSQRERLKTNVGDMQIRLETAFFQRRARLRAVEGLFESSGQVTQQQFAAFNRTALQRAGVEVIEWAPRILHAERPAFEAAARGQGLTGYAIVEFDASGVFLSAAERADYYPLRFATHNRSTVPLGFDFAANPKQRAAMAAAAASTRPALVAREDALVGADGAEWRLLMPVYRTGFDAPAADEMARIEALRGFAVGVLDPDLLWADLAARVVGEQLAVRVSGLADWNPLRSMLIGAVPAGRETQPDWSGHLGDFAGEGLRLEAWSLAPWLPGQATSVRLYFGGGLLLMLLTGIFGFTVSAHGRRMARELARRAASEERLAALIENVQVGVIVHDAQAVIITVNSVAEHMLQLGAADLLGRKTRDSGWQFMREDGSRMPVDDYPGNQALARRQPVKDIVVGVPLPHRQSVIWMLVSAAPIFDAGNELTEVAVTFMDITEQRRLKQREHSRARVMEALGADLPLADILVRIVDLVETEDAQALCSILLLDEAGTTLRMGAAPHLPDFYNAAIDGVTIGPEVGSCGTAAYTRQRVIVADIDSHPYWSGFRDLAARAGLRACWSEPILNAVGRVLGTFAIYRHEPGEPGAADFELIGMAADLARLSIERKQVQETLRESEQRFRTAMQYSPIGMAILAPDGHWLDINHALTGIVGYARDELLATNFQAITHPDDLEADLEQVDAMLERRIKTYQMEKRYLHKAGHTVWTLLDVSLVWNDDGTPRHFISQIQDITERKRTENALALERGKLAAAFDNVDMGLVLSNPQGGDISMNPAALRFHGFASVDQMHLHLADYADEWELRDADGRLIPFEEWPLARAIRGEHLRNAEIRYLHLPTGNRRTCSLTSMSVRDSQRVTALIVMTLLDITDLTRATRDLAELNADLEQRVADRTAELANARKEADSANRAKSEFLATMSHEIRTPMNGVIGMVDVLQQTSLQGYQVEMVDTIRDSAYSLLGIIEDILDFSKIEAGKLDLESLPTPIAEVAEKACSMLDHLAVAKQVDLTLFTDPALPALILGDAQRVRQIIINLANNAIKFSSGQARHGRVAVRAVLAGRSPDGIVVDISVADNGIGMDAATQARLFTAFTQADASTTRRFGGTGLGLSIAHNLAGLMGGNIAVLSAPNEGSTFTLRLPCVAVATAVAAEPGVPMPVAGLTCLVAGDANSLAGDWADYLTADGASVQRVADLAAARAWVAPDALGSWLWLIDAGRIAPDAAELRAIAVSRAADDLRILVVGRGKRRRLRCLDAERRLWEIDANALTRQGLLKAVAIIAGRLAEDTPAPTVGKNAASLAPPARADALRAGRLILIAEDNETNQKVIAQQLALLGFAADVAGDGAQALVRWQSGDYALLLSDLHMPRMDGYELTAAIRTAENGERRLPIIALTANAMRGEAQRCLDAGMDDYLSKPTPLAELQAMLEKWLPTAAPPAPTVIADPIRHPEPGGAGCRIESGMTTAAVDVSVLAALVGDDPATIREFLNDFRVSATGIAAQLAVACAAGNATEAGALAHKLKSSARSVGVLALGELCAEMEAVGRAGNSVALASVLLRFDQEWVAVEASLDSLLHERKEDN